MAKFCTNCGAEMPEGQRFCTSCGAAMSTPQPAPAAPQAIPQAAPQYAAPTYTAQPVDTAPGPNSPYQPISTLGYIGISLLLCIPIVGLVLAILWAFGGCRKINKRNLARAALIMMAAGLVLSLIFGLVIGSAISKATKELRDTIGSVTEQTGISDLLPDSQEEYQDAPEPSSQSGTSHEDSVSETDVLGILSGLLGSSGIDLGELGELGQFGQILQGVTDAEKNYGDMMDEVDKINQQASADNNGWPKSLRDYPGGTSTAEDTYRTRITGTTKEEMLGWIDQLRGDGYQFQDFYDFGLSEDDMLAIDSWWATNGDIYLSVSYQDGTVTVDHTKELPDLSGLFG